MDDYKVGFTPRQLQAMSEAHISSLFYSSNWSRLDNSTKLNLCQEVANRLAAADNVEPRSVVAEKMNGACYGYQQGSKIAINVDMLNDGVFHTTFTGEDGSTVTTTHNVQAPNWNTYDTIVHEHTHGVSVVRGMAPYTYIDSDSDHDLYRIQTEEKNAYDAGNKATLKAIERAEAAMGKQDPETVAYLQSINSETYAKSLENAKLAYNDPFIDKTLTQFIADRDQGIVREAPSHSYKQLQTLYNAQLERQMQEMMNLDNISQKDIQNTTQQAMNTVREDALTNDGMQTPTLQTDPWLSSDGMSAPEPAMGSGHDGGDLGSGYVAPTMDNSSDGMSATDTESGIETGSDGMSATVPVIDSGHDGGNMSVGGADMGSDGADMGSDGGMDNG